MIRFLGQVCFLHHASRLCDGSRYVCWYFFSCLGFAKTILGGGFKDFWNFHPENWGRFPIWLIFFKWVGSTPTSHVFGHGKEQPIWKTCPMFVFLVQVRSFCGQTQLMFVFFCVMFICCGYISRKILGSDDLIWMVFDSGFTFPKKSLRPRKWMFDMFGRWHVFFATAGTASCWGSDLHVGFHMAFEHPPFDSKVRSIYIDVF